MSRAVRQVVSFRVDGDLYGVPIAAVQEIVRTRTIAPVPDVPAGVAGVMNLRGRVIAVLDLRQRLGRPAGARTIRARVLVVEIAGQRIGLLVDEASEVIKVPETVIEPPPPAALAGPDAHPVTGVGKLDGRLILLVDLNHLVSREVLARLAEVEAAAGAVAEQGMAAPEPTVVPRSDV